MTKPAESPPQGAPLDLEWLDFVICGRCETATDVEVADGRITVDSLIDLKAYGWFYDGISWCCPECRESEADHA